MIFKNEKQILKIIKFTPPLFILFISIIILTFQFFEKNATFEREKTKLQEEYINKNKIYIKERVYEIYNYIQNEKKTTEKDLKDSLDIALQNAHSVATTIYNENKNLDKKILKKLIIDALRNIKFNNGRGYFFIYDKKGTNHLLPYNKELEGKNFWNHQDSNGKFIVQDMIKNLKSNNNSFLEWYWFNPTNPNIQKRKIGLVKNFEPFDWFIGTGEYVEDFENELKNKLLSHIKNVRFGKSGYIFIIDYNSVYLSHARKDFIGKNAIRNNDAKNINKVIKDLINISKNGEGYYTYIQNKKPQIEQAIKKTSFVKGLNDWSWMIGTGFYEDDLQKAILDRKNELNKIFEKNTTKTIQLSMSLIIILFLISIYFSKLLQRKFEKYKKEIRTHILKNEEQHNLLSHQSKMAAMGEMIGNIAHQWRQPLSAISTSATGLKLQNELNMLENDLLDKGLDDINNSVQYLSTTIDDFRNFFVVNKKKTSFSIKKSVDKIISLVGAQFQNKNIKIVYNIEDTQIYGLENELIQVIINILNNAKDELLKKDDTHFKLIKIETKIIKNNIIISIQDNAGGIDKNILNRVFEPYFTTKHSSLGTGIGLYMSQEIIIKNMYGNIKASNKVFNYNDVSYEGALFEINIPLKLKGNSQ